jgi:hypothetical protein
MMLIIVLSFYQTLIHFSCILVSTMIFCAPFLFTIKNHFFYRRRKVNIYFIMLSASYNTRLGVTLVTCGIILFLFLWSRDTASSERTSFLVFNSESRDYIPAIPLHIQNNSDTYDSFVETVKQKYGIVRFSGIYSVNDELNTEEEERFRICVDNGPRDLVKNGSLFWKTAQIRRTHHSYLSKKDAVLMEVGGLKLDIVSLLVGNVCF